MTEDGIRAGRPTPRWTDDGDDGDGQSRGVGKLWATLLAFFGAHTGRRGRAS